MWTWSLFIQWLRWTARCPAHLDRRLRKIQTCLLEERARLGMEWNVQLAYPKRPCYDEVLSTSKAQVAIVMQGPLIAENNLTFETVRFYRQTMPNSAVIVSTWEGADKLQVKALEEAGARVLLNRDPSRPGHNNINRQIVSTREGIEAACQMNFEYILKTRADTRVYAPRCVDFLIGMLTAFPVDQRHGLKKRIAVLDLFTRLFVPHHASDILMFGHRSDMHKFWSLPLSSHEPRPLTWNRVGEIWHPAVPEVYLCKHFYQRIEYAYEYTLASWWQALADLFLVIDRHSISHLWPKGYYASDFREGGNDAHLRLMALCTFRDWLNLTRGLMPGSFDEERIQKSLPNERAANMAA